MVSDDESENSQIFEDRRLSEAESDDESRVEIKRLRKQLAELKANQESHKQLKLKQSQYDNGSYREPDSEVRRVDPTEGRTL